MLFLDMYACGKSLEVHVEVHKHPFLDTMWPLGGREPNANVSSEKSKGDFKTYLQ